MSKIRIGIIGAGDRGIRSFGEMFSKQFRDETSVVAFADPNRARVEADVGYLEIQAAIHEHVEDLIGNNKGVIRALSRPSVFA